MANNPFGPRRNEVTIEPNRSGQLWPGGIDPQTNTPINLDQGERLMVDSQSMPLGTVHTLSGSGPSGSDFLTPEGIKEQQGAGEMPPMGQIGFDFGDQ